jgi:hypothetical protein
MAIGDVEQIAAGSGGSLVRKWGPVPVSTLADVLAVGNDLGGHTISGTCGFIVLDDGCAIQAAAGTDSDPGQDVGIGSGGDAHGGYGAVVRVLPANGAGVHGRVLIESDGVMGTIGQVLTAQGDTTAIWEAPRFVATAKWGVD